MNKNQIEKVQLLLSQPKKIVIIPHKNPDGDAMGSTLALYNYLLQKRHYPTVISPNDYPDFLKWLPENESVLNFESNTEQCTKLIAEADIIFTLDFNALHRVDTMQPLLEQAQADFIMIDHHQQPDEYAVVAYSDAAMSSTCEMVYNFIHFLNDEPLINPEIATCLYTGIMTDTGSFKFASTTAQTHKVIAHLITCGANGTAIHNAVYDTNSYNRLQLLGCALNNLVHLKEYNTAYITLSKEELEQHHFKKGDTEGFVNYGLSIEGVVFAVIFIENNDEPFIKISLRSKGNFDVNTFARTHFNGGGHTNAAGGRSNNTMQTTVSQFKTLLNSYKEQLQL